MNFVTLLSLNPLVFFLLVQFCIASTDHVTLTRLTPEQPFRDGDTLVSSGQVFALGFFSPANSSHRYVGIWYNTVSVQTVVWVANRDNPLTDSSGVLSLTPQGNLVLLAKNHTIWSSNVSSSSSTNYNPRARLLDSGNLVLVQNDNTTVIWQSFDHPTDTYLPYMKLGLNRRTGLNWVFTSWKSEIDPGTGNYSYGIDPTGYPQLFLYKGADPWWRVGSWTGVKWSGVPEMTHNFIFNVSFEDNQDEISVLYGIKDSSILSRMVIESSGFVRRSTWNPRGRRWIEFWYDPKEQCDYYKQCGINSICDPYNSESFQCKCLPGFEPKLPREWDLRDGSGGCVRNDQGASICHKKEGFFKVANVKVPDTKFGRVNMSLNLEDCEQECKRNCSCNAYTSADERGFGCMTWHGDLVDTRKYPDMGQDLYVRVDSAMLVDKHILHKKWMIALLIIFPAVLLALVVAFVYRIRKVAGKTKGDERQMRQSFSFTASSGFLDDSSSRKNHCVSGENSELPIFFDLSTIAAATNNFSFVNKLGQGGFGPVYKGHLLNGKDIAVKRLSEHSGQGTHEFKNEVFLIAKLQHRNLVKILGCCIQGKEKMLIYEYLPNKSLDFFLFDESKRSLLDWRKRFSIVYGVARGILYLHEDSRLRIIHRDLKASNVLLDAEMNPKISDFGLARIFGGDEIEGCTNRVVGTYGYMSPEYAMEGLFSIKSDVYSFGVLVLEIVSGKRNSGYFHDNPSLNLVRHVWELWRVGRALEIVDETMGESYEKDEVNRCIQIGLLCVQENAAERPTMSSVVFMLGNDTSTDQLPSPNQPAFTFKTSEKKGATSSTSSSSQGPNCSANYLTHSSVEPR